MPGSPALRSLLATASLSIISIASATLFASDAPALHRGYYTDPSLHGDTIVFTSEGDLWSVSAHGGQAHRLTSGAGTEHSAKFSPDARPSPSAPTTKARPRSIPCPLTEACRSAAPGTATPGQ